MKLHLRWQLFWLSDGKREGLPYTTSVDKIPTESGIYIFGRRWNEDFEALYVGRANRLRSRVRTQLNNARLMNHVKTIGKGRPVAGYRAVYVGVFEGTQGQQWSRCGPVIEKGLIRYFISEEHRLANLHGTQIRTHQIISSGKFLRRVWGSEVAVER